MWWWPLPVAVLWIIGGTVLGNWWLNKRAPHAGDGEVDDEP